jgi:beta-fructofuranosidase
MPNSRLEDEHARHQDAIARATRAVVEASKESAYDEHIPSFHACAGVHWMNDPNGLIYCNGAYHLFYQYNPYHAEWGTIHWGHMRSENLLHWEKLPIALAPSEPYDQDGCLSGSAIERAGHIELYYTANVIVNPQYASEGMLQQQCKAFSDDGIVFYKSLHNPIIQSPPSHVAQPNHFRDPKVWIRDGKGYMVLGAKKDAHGKVLLYTTTDWERWEYVSTLTQSDGTMGYMCECPDLFSLQEEDVLLYCVEGAVFEQSPRTAGYVIGQFHEKTGEYVHGPFLKLDHGFDFYAPQTLQDEQGRRILIGWMPMNGKALGKTWAGCMTVPRELRSDGDGVLRQYPVEELKTLRQREFIVRDYLIDADSAMLLTAQSGCCFEMHMEIDLDQTQADVVEFLLCANESGSQKTTIRYDRIKHELSLDRTHSGLSMFADGEQFDEHDTTLHVEALVYTGESTGPQTQRVEFDVPHWERIRTYKLRGTATGMMKWHLFFDHCALELFIQDGEAVMSGLIFPHPSSQLCKWTSSGGKTVIREMRYWAITSRQSWTDLDLEWGNA